MKNPVLNRIILAFQCSRFVPASGLSVLCYIIIELLTETKLSYVKIVAKKRKPVFILVLIEKSETKKAIALKRLFFLLTNYLLW